MFYSFFKYCSATPVTNTSDRDSAGVDPEMLRLLGVSPIVTREAVSILTIKIQRLGTYQHWILEYLIQGIVDHQRKLLAQKMRIMSDVAKMMTMK